MNIYFLKIFYLHFQKLFLSLFYFLDKIFVGKNCIGKLFKICPETGQNRQQQRRAAKASAQRAAQPAWTQRARGGWPRPSGDCARPPSLSAQWPSIALGFLSQPSDEI